MIQAKSHATATGEIFWKESHQDLVENGCWWPGGCRLSSLPNCPEHLMATKNPFSSHVDPKTRESSAGQKVSPQKASVHCAPR